MFCPNCRTEYRPGFTRCSDCGADLVPDPPQDALSASPPAPGDPNDDPFCSFWKGEDPRVHAELCEVLDEAGIPHKSAFRRDHLFNFNNFPRYEIGVPFSLFEKAEKLVEAAYATEDAEDRETLNRPRLLRGSSQNEAQHPSESSENNPHEIPGPPGHGLDTGWFPEDATARVWSGELEQGEFLVAALHENEIACRLDQQGTAATLFVLPQEEARAGEIVREVVEAAPPEADD